jgi:SAM-dependent methyltransferase
MLKKLNGHLKFLGIDAMQGMRNLKALNWFYKDYRSLRKQLSGNGDFPFGSWYPILSEKFASSGILSGYYFHQDLLVAKRVFANKPEKHVDIGSRTDGFVAHVAVFREIEVFDIRPLVSKVENIRFIQADFMRISPELKDYTDSISCLHAIEHFGLGRYNDPVDALGHVKGLDSMYQVLKKGGKFYFSTPIGKQRIEFNAHRVFSLSYLLDLFEDKYRIDHFSYVDDAGDLHENAELAPPDVQSNFGCTYGCGIFEMTKR